MENYELPEGLKKKVVDYCYEKIRGYNSKYFKDNRIRKGLFMEILFAKCVENIYLRGTCEVSEETVELILKKIMFTDRIFKEFIDGRLVVLGVKDMDDLIFKKNDLIEYKQ